MRPLSTFLHHRSLTASLICLFFAFVAFSYLPEHSFRLRQQGMDYLMPATISVAASLVVCALTLLILVRDNQSGYPSFRCSLATLFWAFACVPVFWLFLILVRAFF
jgi:hypothetical protein